MARMTFSMRAVSLFLLLIPTIASPKSYMQFRVGSINISPGGSRTKTVEAFSPGETIHATANLPCTPVNGHKTPESKQQYEAHVASSSKNLENDAIAHRTRTKRAAYKSADLKVNCLTQLIASKLFWSSSL